MPDNKIPKVTKGCIDKNHRCMSCYENKKYYEKRGLPRNIQFQIVRMLKVKEFTVEELSLMLNYPAEIIQKTLDTMIKSGLISIEDKEVKP